MNSQESDIDPISDRVKEMHLQNSEDALLSEYADLPNIVIVTNIDVDVFENASTKCQFETMFQRIDPTAEFQYLKSFRRARVVLQNGITATKCRIQLNDTQIANNKIQCYFAQPQASVDGSQSPHLRPPIPDKQFLISPPASPPVGWEPVQESEPIINYDLLAAVSRLAPDLKSEIKILQDELNSDSALAKADFNFALVRHTSCTHEREIFQGLSSMFVKTQRDIQNDLTKFFKLADPMSLDNIIIQVDIFI